MKVAVIGGGAAGFFSAFSVKEHHPEAEVMIIEKSNKVLAKVKVSGGGRCNVTNGCTSIAELAEAYPRGGRFLKKAFVVFNTKHTHDWFTSRGVKLVTQEDNCVFPESQSSQTIIDCFLDEAKKYNIAIKTSKGVKALSQVASLWKLDFLDEDSQFFDKVIVCVGGNPKLAGYEWLQNLGLKIEPPVPSLFTFNMPSEPIKALMGIVVEPAMANIQSTKLKSDGPLLITHWGMSGPAILKLSAFGARVLSESQYNFKTQVNWSNEPNFEIVMAAMEQIVKEHPQKMVSNIKPFGLSERLWHFLLEKTEIPLSKKWSELGKKGLNKLVNVLVNDIYEVSGKTTFKEEFVTCGGVSLEQIDVHTMQSKVCPGLYFAGEVMDIDGITGGYNFQAAWTTGFIAGKLG